MKNFFVLSFTFFSLAIAQEIQYDYKVNVYPVKTPQKILKVRKTYKASSVLSSRNQISNESFSSQDIETLKSQVNNISDPEIKALLLKILNKLEENEKLIKGLSKSSCNEERIIKKLSRIIQDKLYLSRKYTYAYIKKVLEEYKKEIDKIIKENNENLKEELKRDFERSLDTKILKAKNDLASLVSQSSSDVKNNIEDVKNNLYQISNKLDSLSKTQNELKETLVSNFSFIKYLLIGISVILVLGFIILGFKLNKASQENIEEKHEEEE